LGIGIGNFGPNVAGYPPSAPEEGWLIVNNEPLEILAETGILGFLSIILFLGCLFFRGLYAAFKSKDLYLKIWLIGLLAVLLAFAVQYQTFSTLYITHIWVAIGLLAATQNIFQKNKGIKNV
jgi:O-antigen ligase